MLLELLLGVTAAMLGCLWAVGRDKACLDGEYKKATTAHMKTGSFLSPSTLFSTLQERVRATRKVTASGVDPGGSKPLRRPRWRQRGWGAGGFDCWLYIG